MNKIQPCAKIVYDDGNDGRDRTMRIVYTCPKCNKTIWRGDIACDKCGTFMDWSKKAYIKIKSEIEWR